MGERQKYGDEVKLTLAVSPGIFTEELEAACTRYA